ncbi:MAG: AAA family ATPase [Actinomycetota bacterium]|nr:AAA family ATPase [Actinomycetota bacterium]
MRACSSCGREIDGDVVFCPHCGAALASAPAREQRKTVTVLFCDVTGSTSLGESIDPEALRGLLARYFERMKAIVERHGGTVEKFIGDAVMAVFGVPAAHEDDALRAVRAAMEMREALPGLGVQARIGVNTGQVVTGTEERLVTGDAVNVAARLEQAAAPGDVLIGAPTLALLRDAADVEPVEPLELKGKARRMPAYRLLRVHEAPERSHGARFVGRGRELTTIREAWERVQAGRLCELVTVTGEAGVGKSRLIAETLASLEATVVRGRCLPYGEGITYWPVVEILKQLAVQPEDAAAATSIRSLLGQTDAATSAEEIAWAFRKTLERAAADRPVVAVFDDIQWGEETFLDLIEHVALLSSGAPILVLCMARPELTDRRSGWPVTFRLEPLGDQEVDELLPERIPNELRTRIASAAGGNPLFIEEMLAMSGEADSEVVVPPTLHALLAARLDQLEPTERTVLELGAVEGEIFHRGAVQALAPQETRVTPRLAALVRKELIRPDRAHLPGEDGFRFRHLLIRDAAYEALPKATRAELHRNFAFWLEEHGTSLVELDEVLGYHFEQAHWYREELGLPVDGELAAAARRRLTAAGRRAYRRGDYRAAVSLLERAAALLPLAEIDLLLETMLADALFEGGRGAEAIRRAEATAERASAAADRVGELCARILVGRFRMSLEPEGAAEALAALIEEALPVFQAAGAHLALYVAYYALGYVELNRGRADAVVEALDHAFAHAQGVVELPAAISAWSSGGRLYGTMPVPELLAWMDEQEALRGPDPLVRRDRAQAVAMLGRFDEARELIAGVRSELADRGAGIQLGATLCVSFVEVELLAGDPVAAAELGEEGCRLLDELGERGFLSYAAGLLGEALYELDRLDDADSWASRGASLGGSDDASTQMLCRRVRAKVLVRRGEHDEAERLAREAVAIGRGTDMLDDQGDTLVDLAEVLSLAGRLEEAAEALEQAVVRFELKGNVVKLARTRDRLARVLGEAAR